MKETLEAVSAHLILIAKEMGQLAECVRRDKLIKELKIISRDIHNYKVEDMKMKRKEITDGVASV